MYAFHHEVLKMLHDEHLATLGLLDRLDVLLRRLGPDTPPPADDRDAKTLLGEVAANMLDESSHHFAFEEEHLFPLFSAAAEPGIPAMLQSEHEAIRPLAKRLAELTATGGGEGIPEESWREFHRVGRELIEREVFHIQKEEMGFLPAMDQILGSEEAAELAVTLRGIRETGRFS